MHVQGYTKRRQFKTARFNTKQHSPLVERDQALVKKWLHEIFDKPEKQQELYEKLMRNDFVSMKKIRKGLSIIQMNKIGIKSTYDQSTIIDALMNSDNYLTYKEILSRKAIETKFGNNGCKISEASKASFMLKQTGSLTLGNTNPRERVATTKQKFKLENDGALEAIPQDASKQSFAAQLLEDLQKFIKNRLEIPQRMLFLCWYANIDSDRVERLILNVSKEILNPNPKCSAEDIKREVNWFKKCLLSSLIFYVQCNDGKYLFEKLNDIVQKYEHDVEKELNNIYNDLTKEKRFKQLQQIGDEAFVKRQDDPAVGLLSNLPDGIKNKNHQETVNIYLGLSELMLVGQRLHVEFNNFMYDLFKPLKDKDKLVEFSHAPLKTFDRCHAKVEISS